MGWISDIFAAGKGKVNAAGEAIVDSQAVTIFEQRIREAKQNLIEAKQSLADVIGKKKLADQKAADLKAKIADYEQKALALLNAGNEALATEVAEKISKLEPELATAETYAKTLAGNVEALKKAVTKAEGDLKTIEQQVDMVKATDAVQKAQASVADKVSNMDGSMGSVQSSLERIKAKQAATAARLEAASEIVSPDADLDARINAATGGDSSTNSVLARLKAKQQG